ncbi:tail fiber protein [Salmonella sp. SG203]|uniref:tail fiber protein n=1 Tax=Salmonella sp. SG203 TaxID=2555397 RepID=UPI0035CBF886
MGKLTEITQWEEDIYQLETSDPVVGGPDGVSNKPQKQLANRTQWLKQQLKGTDDALAEHAKSRNHPDASLTAKGFVQLYSGVMSDSEILAATPKAVKIAMDNANARLAKNRNLADLTNIPLARQSLRLGNSATRDVGTTEGTVAAGDDSRITGAMQKDQNGADISDKEKFVQNVGLTDTVNRASHVQASDGNIYGTVWGGWLSDYIRRNTPSIPSMPSLAPYATINWVNQTFVRDVRLGSTGETATINGGTSDCPPVM